MPPESDPVLRRLGRTALASCLLMTVLAMVLGGGARAALAVLGGGLLIAISYGTIGSGASALVELLVPGTGERPPGQRPRLARTLAAVAGRYALLALLAYVMIARLRLHPVGLMAGASSVVAAAAVEAIRQITRKS